ncbi:MAG: hypothetical protein JNM31_12980 [Flavobacteriales bacterium]|nr:hypothetical protein [Flavobacteriales bacterium]
MRVPSFMSALFNISYNDARVRQEVERICGKPLGLWQAIHMGGVGTARFTLLKGPPAIEAYLLRPEDRRCFSLELRSKGVLLRGRCYLETLGVPIDDKSLAHWSIAPSDEPNWRELQLELHGGERWLFRVPVGQVPVLVGLLREARRRAADAVMELQKHANGQGATHDRHGP